MQGGLPRAPTHGALVLSLDFEQHWGMRDHIGPDDPYRAILVGGREAVVRMLETFVSYEMGATWATVGMLFARSKEELDHYSPLTRPTYVDHTLYPYTEPVGADESEDPIHFAWSLVEQIAATPGQEVGSHTFSHYYCLESGQSKETFKADLVSAKAIAHDRGIQLRSIVLPRNQWNPEYAPVLHELGFNAYRGPQQGSIYGPRRQAEQSLPARGRRFADAYLNLTGPSLTAWSEVVDRDGLCNVAASRYLRPYSPQRRAFDGRRLRRVVDSMTQAARDNKIFHLWWHPHDFGRHLEENVKFLVTVLDAFSELRQRFGMASLTMADVADSALQGAAAGQWPS